MVVDTSAVVAIFLLEPEAGAFANAMQSVPRAVMSAANLLEAGIVLDQRAGAPTSDLDEFVSDSGLEIEPVTLEQVRIARHAYQTYGKGIHPAGLNFGDCFAYALAKAREMPLLFKGNDFTKTDIAVYRPNN